MKEELMPYIGSRYRTAPFTILSGHSLGGLLALHCLVHHPDYFNAYISISPSLQWDNEKLLSQFALALKQKKALDRILFFSSANENEAFQKNQFRLDSLLKNTSPMGLKYR